MAAQELDADRVEGAEPRHALDIAFADQHADALLHLARGLVGEGDGEDLRGVGEAGGEDMGDAGGQDARLAGAGAGEHQNRPFGGLDGEALLGVQALQIVRRLVMALPRGHGARGKCPSRQPWAWRRRSFARTRSAGTRPRLLVEKGHVVGKVGHLAQCSDSGAKDQQRRCFVPVALSGSWSTISPKRKRVRRHV